MQTAGSSLPVVCSPLLALAQQSTNNSIGCIKTQFSDKTNIWGSVRKRQFYELYFCKQCLSVVSTGLCYEWIDGQVNVKMLMKPQISGSNNTQETIVQNNSCWTIKVKLLFGSASSISICFATLKCDLRYQWKVIPLLIFAAKCK